MFNQCEQCPYIISYRSNVYFNINCIYQNNTCIVQFIFHIITKSLIKIFIEIILFNHNESYYYNYIGITIITIIILLYRTEPSKKKKLFKNTPGMNTFFYI